MRIGEKRTAILCPMIDVIDDKSLAFSDYGGVAVGGFSWSLHFTWHPVFERENKRRKSPADYIRWVRCRRLLHTFCQPSFLLNQARWRSFFFVFCHLISLLSFGGNVSPLMSTTVTVLGLKEFVNSFVGVTRKFETMLTKIARSSYMC